MNIKNEKELVIFLRKMLVILPKYYQTEKLRVSGLVIFTKDKILVFGPKGKPDPDIVHAIVDRGNNMIIGFFYSSDEYVISNEFQYNILYRLQPFFIN